MKANLGDRALVTHRLAAGVETSFAARAFDGGVDPNAFLGFLAQHLDHVDGPRISNPRGHSQRLAAVLHMHLVIMAATITASTAGMTSSFVMIEFDENGGFIRWAAAAGRQTAA